MPGLFEGVSISNVPGFIVFLVLWIVLCECAHLCVIWLRQEPLIGWGVGPFGLTFMVLREPSLWSIWVDVVFTALISGCVLYVGLFTALSPVVLPAHPFWTIGVMAVGIALTSILDICNALRDLRYPLWGEARVLRTIQILRTPWTRIHFTPFGHSYVQRHFGFNPPELLQSLSL